MFKGLSHKVIVFLSIISLVSVGLPSKTAFAALPFDPLFGVNVADTSAGANSNLTGTIEQASGDDLVRNVTFNVPAGWDIANGSSFAQNEVVGSGQFSEFNLNINRTFSGNLILRNNLTINPGDKAHWLVDFADPVSGYVYLTIDAYVAGDIFSGHTIRIVRTVNLPHITTPARFDFTFLGKTASNLPVFTNPTLAGDYTWSIDSTSESGLTATRSQTLIMPGSVTPTGSNVSVPLGDSVSVTFDSVTLAGQTSIATSETVPPEDSGQFQLSGGLYYDINTTATFSCPCTVTLPYDPTTTPNPRIYHQEEGVWVDVTLDFDPNTQTVRGIVSSFSLFAPGSPVNAGVDYLSPIEALQKSSSQIEVQADRTLPVNFGLYDSNTNFIENSNVSVQIVQIKDALGNPIVPVQKARIAAKLASKKHYQANLNLHDLGLDEGTYRIRVILVDTVLPQIVDLVPRI